MIFLLEPLTAGLPMLPLICKSGARPQRLPYMVAGTKCRRLTGDAMTEKQMISALVDEWNLNGEAAAKELARKFHAEFGDWLPAHVMMARVRLYRAEHSGDATF